MMRRSACPSDSTLLSHALEAGPGPGIAAHVATCSACGARVAEHRQAAARLRRAAALVEQGVDCLDEMAVARITEGSGTSAELDHLAECAGCRTAVAAVAGAIASAPISAEIERLEMPLRRVWQRRVAVAGVAAAVLLATTLMRSPAAPGVGGEPTYRDPAIVQVSPPSALEPVDQVVSRPVELRWTSSAAATEYRLTVFDEEGSIMWEGKTADTSVAVPADVSLAAGVPYWWRVEARVGFDRWVQSAVTPFTIDRPAVSAPAKGR